LWDLLVRQDFRDAVCAVERECLALRVRRLNRRVTRIYDLALRPHGVRIAQFNILVALGLHDVSQSSNIARALDLERSTLHRNIRRMVGRGWVAVSANARGSPHELRLTPAGKRVLAGALPAWRGAQRRAAEQIKADIVDTLERATPPRGTRRRPGGM